jgi:hypothetical protein
LQISGLSFAEMPEALHRRRQTPPSVGAELLDRNGSWSPTLLPSDGSDPTLSPVNKSDKRIELTHECMFNATSSWTLNSPERFSKSSPPEVPNRIEPPHMVAIDEEILNAGRRRDHHPRDAK